LTGEETSKDLRLQYSGYIIFVIQIFSVVTGLIFTLLLTRNMSSDQYGLWTNVFDYTAYFTLFSGLMPFWATRFVARGKVGTIRTSTLAQLLIGLVSTVIYFPIIYVIYTFAIEPTLKIHKTLANTNYLPIFLIAGLYIVTFYMITNFEAVLQPKKPHALGYGLLIEEIVKVSVALVLILGFKQLFLGAVLALVMSCFVQVGYYVWLLKDDFKQKTDWGYLKEWLKGSTALAYNAVGNQLMSFVLIMLFFFGGPSTRAYYQAAGSFTVIIGYSISLSIALYPKLLARGCSSEQVGTSFRTVMMLGVPLTAITMAMSYSFLTVLRNVYGVAWPVLIGLSIYTLIGLVTSFYSNCVMGVEAFDYEGKISLRHLVRSKIFKLFTLPYIQAAIALPTAYLVLTRLSLAGSVHATIAVIAILIAVQISTFGALYWYMRHSISIPVAWLSMAKFVLASALMVVILLVIPTTTTLLSTIAKAIVGFLIYAAILLAIDKQARELVKQIWAEFKGSLQVITTRKKSGDVSLGEKTV
jgi:O-antigen/teichoic acid export membrane protein